MRGQTLTLNFDTEPKEVVYTFPETKEDIENLEHLWFCPTLFSLFDCDTFLHLMTLLLLEKSVVFVSNNLTMLTNIIHSLKLLLSPFQWYYPLIYVLPQPLMELLETPQPILMGITRDDYAQLSLTDEEKEFRNWVFIDGTEVVFKWEADLAQTLTLNSIFRWYSGRTEYKIRDQFNIIHFGTSQVSDLQMRQSESSYRECRHSLATPSDSQRIACKEIIHQVAFLIEEKILKQVPALNRFRQSYDASVTRNILNPTYSLLLIQTLLHSRQY